MYLSPYSQWPRRPEGVTSPGRWLTREGMGLSPGFR